MGHANFVFFYFFFSPYAMITFFIKLYIIFTSIDLHTQILKVYLFWDAGNTRRMRGEGWLIIGGNRRNDWVL